MIDYATLQIQYELFNESIESLAQSAEVPEDLLAAEIEKRGWTRKIQDNPLVPATVDDVEQFSSAFIESTKSKLTILSLARQLALADKYAKLENTLATKALEVAATLESHDLPALKRLTSIFKDLTEHSVTTSVAQSLAAPEESGVGKISVNIINEFVKQTVEQNKPQDNVIVEIKQ